MLAPQFSRDHYTQSMLSSVLPGKLINRIGTLGNNQLYVITKNVEPFTKVRADIIHICVPLKRLSVAII